MGKQLFKLAKTDVVKTYRGAALGWSWAIIRPAVTIFVYWFGMAIGLRHSGEIAGYPYFLWLIAGFTPWFYMRDCFNSGTGCIRRYKYLVKRIKYPVDTIPTFCSMAYLIINLGLTLILFAIFIAQGHMPTKYYLQIPLFMLMMFVFCTAWMLFASMLAAISKDFLNLVHSMVPALFWLSGILYDATQVHQVWIRRLLMFNPVTIVTNGYRNAMIYQKWFWETPVQMRNYCIVTGIMILLAIWAYRKLKADIPDVL